MRDDDTPRRCLAPDPRPLPPSVPLPAGACDTHCHVMGPPERFPYVAERSYTPPDAPLQAYLALREALGIERSVIVQPGPHGLDNRVTLDAVKRIGAGARGVVVVDPAIDPAEIAAMHQAGVRGVRLSTLLRGRAVMEDLPAMAAKVAPFGWHILLHLKSSAELVELAPILHTLPAGIVIDHLGRVTGPEGPDSEPFRALLSLLETSDHCWTKVCSWYRISGEEAPFADMGVLARAVMEAREDRILWGTNWPHPLLFEPPMPNDGALLGQFLDWAGTQARRRAVLVDNPARLYGF